MAAPVEAKVKTATAAAALTGLVLGFIQQYLFKGGQVPDFVVVFVTSAVGSAVLAAATFLVSWTTKHTPQVLQVETDPLRETPWSDNPTG